MVQYIQDVKRTDKISDRRVVTRSPCALSYASGKYISYQFGGLVLDTFSMRVIVYAALTVITLPLARLGFKKHQVA